MNAPLTLAFVGPEEAAAVREIMFAAFAEYESVLKVPSSAMWESVEDVAGHIALGGAVLARVGSETVGSGRYELREDHVYIGRLSVLPAFRQRGISTAMMEAMEGRALAAGRKEARISVRVLLPRNISLYERLGYVVTARYQHERGDELVVDMAKQLEK
ncbi:MAG: GNAT family N-acetyltransferase [Dehalococcoidia bacterium]